MLKILAILVLIWFFFKALGMIFRTVIGSGDANRNARYGGSYSGRQSKNGVNVDHDPNESNKGYKGGEYVDYEEIEE